MILHKDKGYNRKHFWKTYISLDNESQGMQVENVTIDVDEIYTTVILCLQKHNICLGNESQSMNVEYVTIEMKIYTNVVLSSIILCLQKHIMLHLLIVIHCLVPQETSVLYLNKLHTLTLMSVLTKLVGRISLHNWTCDITISVTCLCLALDDS